MRKKSQSKQIETEKWTQIDRETRRDTQTERRTEIHRQTDKDTSTDTTMEGDRNAFCGRT